MGTSTISRAINGHLRTAGGYIWKKVTEGYPKDKLSDDIINDALKNHQEKRSICQMDDDNNIIHIYESISEASRNVGVNAKSIRLAANGEQKHAGGYCWKYMENAHD